MTLGGGGWHVGSCRPNGEVSRPSPKAAAALTTAYMQAQACTQASPGVHTSKPRRAHMQAQACVHCASVHVCMRPCMHSPEVLTMASCDPGPSPAAAAEAEGGQAPPAAPAMLLVLPFARARLAPLLRASWSAMFHSMVTAVKLTFMMASWVGGGGRQAVVHQAHVRECPLGWGGGQAGRGAHG